MAPLPFMPLQTDNILGVEIHFTNMSKGHNKCMPLAAHVTSGLDFSLYHTIVHSINWWVGWVASI